MAEGDTTIFNSIKKHWLNKIVDMDGDTFKATLHYGLTLNATTQTTWANISSTEYTSHDGYTAGGKSLASLSLALDGANTRVTWDAADLTWTSLGPMGTTPSHLVIWDDTLTAPDDGLVLAVELSTAPNGGNYTISFSATAIFVVA